MLSILFFNKRTHTINANYTANHTPNAATTNITTLVLLAYRGGALLRKG